MKPQSLDAEIGVPEWKRPAPTFERLERQNAVLRFQITDLTTQVGRLLEELNALRKQNLSLGTIDNYSSL